MGEKVTVGSAFRLFLEGQPLEGAATVVEQQHVDRNGKPLLSLEIVVYDASQRDVDLVQSMHSFSSTGVNFVRIGVTNYDPDDPVDELAMAMVLMGESPRDYEGMVLRNVDVRREAQGQTNVRMLAEQWFRPSKEVRP